MRIVKMKKLIIILFLSSVVHAGMLFNADNERVNCGNSAAINNLATITLISWQYLIAANENNITARKANDNESVDDFEFSTTISDECFGSLGRATTGVLVWSNTDQFVASKWIYTVVVMDSTGANGDQHIYYGDLSTLATECGAYSQQRVGAGARTGGASNLGIGNFQGGTVAWPNTNKIIAVFAIFNTTLTQGQIRSFQYHPRAMENCVGLWFPGLHGASTVPDLAGNGNNGTVFNATLDVHVPLRAPFGASMSLDWFMGTLPAISEGNSVTMTPDGKITQRYPIFVNNEYWQDVSFITEDVKANKAVYRINIGDSYKPDRIDFPFKPKDPLDLSKGLVLETTIDINYEVKNNELRRK